MNRTAHSRDLRRNRLSNVPATFFITKSLFPKRPPLDVDARKVVVSAFEFAVQEQRIYLRAFVVMPDHWHGLIALCEPWTLPRFMHAMMSFIAARTSPNMMNYNTAWQDTYYDTRIRTAKQFAYVQNYIEQNPVVRNLADKPDQWSASSASRPDLVTEPWPWFFD